MKLACSSLAAVLVVACATPVRPVRYDELETGVITVPLDELRARVKEAYLWGYPLVDNYRVVYWQAIDRSSDGFKAPINVIASKARVARAGDKTVQTPNSDTPYSNLVMDLRTEPLVLSVPRIDAGRYFSIQLVDAYTHNYAYIGTRTTGNEGGHFLIAGPDWKDPPPPGITAAFPCETWLAKATYRTQLLDAGDIEAVKAIQAGYRVQPLSSFLGVTAPAPAPAVDWIEPPGGEAMRTSLEFFRALAFTLQFCPTHASEVELRARLASLGLEAGKRFDPATLTPEQAREFQAGVKDAWQEFAGLERRMDAKEVTSADAFGTREHLANDYLLRFGGDVVGIYGNSAEEALYPIYQVDAEGQPLDGARSRYRLRFAPDGFPPVNAFWSVTMYSLPDRFLVENPIDRYLVNSPMLPELMLDADGGLTIFIQHERPEGEQAANWLPAPAGPFFLSMRLYWPKPAALDGSWKEPPLVRSH